MLSGHLQSWIRSILAEDIGSGDATTLATIPESARARARMVARREGVIAGVDIALAVFRELSPDVHVAERVADGTRVGPAATLAVLEGPARALLTGERVALNCVQRLSGIATLTAEYVAAAGSCRILDTRKTTPGWRQLEKYAVACGGGTNHRQRLDDLILIKDNHLVALRDAEPSPIAAAVRLARRARPHLRVEVEADTLDQVRQAVEAGADIVLLDNMSVEQLREAVALCRGRAQTEASGGIRLANIAEIAATGVDFISVGALTHAASWLDIGLDFEA